MSGSSVSPEDQEFLALLVHRRFLTKDAAISVMQDSSVNGFMDSVMRNLGMGLQEVEFLRSTNALLKPKIPGYVALERVGTGGTADVFRAKRESDGARVALKMMLPALRRDALAKRRFVEEGKLLQSLQHSSIVAGHRTFKFVGTYVMEMDFIDGQTLEELLDMQRSFSEQESLSIILHVARGLEYLRCQGILHRDLKPGNIMRRVDGSIVLIDLGFAGPEVGGDGIGGGTTLGTPAYLSPEQAMGDDSLDARADIYSLGVTLYHLAVGELPFQGQSDAETMRLQILEGLSGGKM
ncbi:MAG: serine/threonine protein kinase, partial [Planctomycetes bacterium]|nr:serine/threonine protein kinase [Planctomycetota bacterium]